MKRAQQHFGRRQVLALAGGTLAATATAQAARAAGPVPIRYATGGGIGSSEIETVIFNAAMPAGVLPRAGRDYDLQLTFTSGTPEAATLLAAGQADMATLSCSAFAAGLLRGAFADGVTVVSDNYQDGRADYANNAFFVAEAAPIHTPDDLRGKRVAINAYGSAVDLVLRVYLKRHGIDPRKDLQIVEIGLPNIGTALRQGRADCGVLVLPFQAVEAAKGGLRMLFRTAEVLGPSAVVFNVVSNAFLRRAPDAVRAMLADYVGALDWLMQPANHAAAVSVTSKLTHLAPETLGYIMTKRDYYRAPDGRLDAALIQGPIDALHDLGLLTQNITAANYVDMRYLPGGAR